MRYTCADSGRAKGSKGSQMSFLDAIRLLVFAAAVLVLCAAGTSARPLRLHPKNPHYFQFRGKPTVLITSGEHYGALLNLDFDYGPYFDELQSHGLNLTRTFSGVYRESPESFNIKNNTLAPRSGRYICPWARSDTPGYANGGNKFDLTRWDPEYFRRLKDFVREADRHGVVVELVLFCTFYNDTLWRLSPMNAANNVNGVGKDVPRTEVYTLKHTDLLEVHRAVTRKIVRELRGFDNVYFEVCNEPYFAGVTRDWQNRIVATIVETEKDFAHRHLIARNVANGSKKVTAPNPNVSVLNFHYAAPPTAVAVNYHLNRAIGDDETGFDGPKDVTYRREGWHFLLAGGVVYSNLDYSFTPEHEDGSAVPDAPGGGGRSLRRQLGILKDFMNRFDFVDMRPADSVLKGGIPDGATARVLADEGREYALYIDRGSRAKPVLELPAGRYRAEWVSPRTGKVVKTENFRHRRGTRALQSPSYGQDIALCLKRR